MLTLRGASIAVDGVHTGGRIELSVSGNDIYRVRFLHDGRQVAERVIRQHLGVDGSLRVHTLAVPEGIQWNGVLLMPAGGDSFYSLGHFRLLPQVARIGSDLAEVALMRAGRSETYGEGHTLWYMT